MEDFIHFILGEEKGTYKESSHNIKNLSSNLYLVLFYNSLHTRLHYIEVKLLVVIDI